MGLTAMTAMQNNPKDFDRLFQQAVGFLDAGDEQGLSVWLDRHPELVTQRLMEPGDWVTSVIGDALKSFLKEPYLLWFVSEDAVRHGKLPANIAAIASLIIEKAQSVNTANLQEQIDYGLRLVAWSWVAKKCGVQNELLDVFIDAGAAMHGVSNDALVNRHLSAAEHLVNRDAPLTLPTAVCLGRWEEADRLAISASNELKQFTLVLAALNGNAAAVSRTLSYGADVNKTSADLYSHGTPLHHAVASGSMDAVKILVDNGANLFVKDTVYGGRPLDWAVYGKQVDIATYLKNKMENVVES